MTEQALSQQKGQQFIKRLIAFQSVWYMQIFAFVGLLALFYIFCQNWSITTNIMLAMTLHECGHAVVYWKNKIKCKIIYLFPLGAVAAPNNELENAKSDQLPWQNIAWLLQAGPATNILLVLAGTLLDNSQVLELAQFGKDMILVNALLGISNLIPVWQLDAGQLYFVIFSSLKEKYEKILTLVIFATIFFIIIALVIVPVANGDMRGIIINLWGEGKSALLIVFFLIFLAGFCFKRGKDNPALADSPQAMTFRQVLFQMIVYFVVVMSGLCLAMSVPW